MRNSCCLTLFATTGKDYFLLLRLSSDCQLAICGAAHDFAPLPLLPDHQPS